MKKLPENFLGADLFWWRESGQLHTLISIFWAEYVSPEDEIELTFCLYDSQGRRVSSWTKKPAAFEAIHIDSASPPFDSKGVEDGVLAVIVSTKTRPSPELEKRYSRLYSMIDWYSEDGSIATLHNDQSIIRNEISQKFTEIVVREDSLQENSLVLLAGTEGFEENSIELEVQNCSGETRSAVVTSHAPPFTVLKLSLKEHFPELLSFAAGAHLLVSASLKPKQMFLRPYVVSDSPALSAYHGGDVYESIKPTPHFVQKFLERGYANPAAVVENEEMSCTANFLNSHGNLEEDFWIDAALYDSQGTLVVEKKKWLLAERGKLARGDISDLLPASVKDFRGHLLASFSIEEQKNFPGLLQILMEYRSNPSTSRVMLWGDAWNTPERLHKPDRPLWRKYQRVWLREPLSTTISVTNTANQRDYSSTASYTLKLFNANGDHISSNRSVEAYATDFLGIKDVFPNAVEFLGALGVGICVMESQFDLPSIQFTKHEHSKAFAVEHFMACSTNVDGKRKSPAGS